MQRVLQQSVLIAAAVVLLLPAHARAQDDDDSGGAPAHNMNTGGQISKGIPRFCLFPCWGSLWRWRGCSSGLYWGSLVPAIS